METSTDRPNDADLLRACVAGDRTAVAELVRRHGQTVYAVCRAALGDGADADDAFQATFLVLLHRAGRVRRPDAVAGWLCGVAARVARRARQRRPHTGGETVTIPDPAPAADPAVAALDRDARSAVWDELGGLPDVYRDPLVLCHLEGRTTEQAAAALGCPVGTVRSRLLRGREMLRGRLARRGLALSAAAVLLLLTETRAAADPPPELIRRVGAGEPAGPSVSELVEGVMRDLQTRWQPVAVLAVVLAGAVAAIALTAPPEPVRPMAAPMAVPMAALVADRVGPLVGPGTLLVVSQRDATVMLVDPATGRTRATVPTDPCPHEVAVSPDGTTAAVANYGLPFGDGHGRTVTLIDVAAGTKTKTVDVGAGAGPHGLQWLDDRRLLCTVEKAEAVVEIDATDGKVTRTLRTAQQGTHMVVAAAGGKRAYTANVLSNTVSALDPGEGVKVKDRAVGTAPEGIAVSPDGTRVWVGNRADKTLSVLAADDLAVLKTIPAPGGPFRLAFAPDGKTVLVTEINTGELSVFDAEKMSETKRIKMTGGKVTFDTPGPPPGPAGVVVSADGRTAYCTMFFSNAVAVVDLTAGAVTGKIELAGGAPDGIALSRVGPKS